MENTTYSNMEKITDEAPRNTEHKELKCGMEEVRKLVEPSLEENISLESFGKLYNI